MTHNQLLVDKLLLASRTLVGIATRSLDDLDTHISLPQFRALVVLGEHGPMNLTALGRHVGVHVSSAQRVCTELVGRGLLRRTGSADSGSGVIVSLAGPGLRLVDQVMRRRQAEITRIVDRIPHHDRTAIVDALQAFADAACIPDPAWFYGWSQPGSYADRSPRA